MRQLLNSDTYCYEAAGTTNTSTETQHQQHSSVNSLLLLSLLVQASLNPLIILIHQQEVKVI